MCVCAGTGKGKTSHPRWPVGQEMNTRAGPSALSCGERPIPGTLATPHRSTELINHKPNRMLVSRLAQGLGRGEVSAGRDPSWEEVVKLAAVIVVMVMAAGAGVCECDGCDKCGPVVVVSVD